MKQVGVGTRVINFLIDTIAVFLISYGLYKWWVFYVRYWEYPYYPFYYFFWATMFVYYTLFELLTSRTPGKLLTMTKVRTVSGKRPAFYQVLLRSLLRLTLIDPFFIPVFEKPLHDALSKTVVVEV
jgi:uncharacterized RDD family membrane protein YckC